MAVVRSRNEAIISGNGPLKFHVHREIENERVRIEFYVIETPQIVNNSN
jgi:hypothetical protein